MTDERQEHDERLEQARKVNRARQARWRANNLEKSRKQGREKSRRYEQKKKQLKLLESPQMSFDF